MPWPAPPRRRHRGTDAAAALRRALQRSGRREQLRAAALVLPLFLFLLATLHRADRRDARRAASSTPTSRAILPRVTAALAHWDGRELPPDAAYAALIADVRAAREAGTLASAATRLNYDVAGFRSLLFATGRRAAGARSTGSRARDAGRDRSEVGRARDLGGDPPRRRDRSPISTCSRRSTCGATPTTRSSARRAEQAVFRNVLGRTLWISGVVTLVCLLLGYPVALLHRAAAARARRAAALPRAAAVLDVAAGAHRRLGRAAAARGHPQQPAAVARTRRRAAADDLQPLRRLRRDGARAAAVHGAAALRGDEGHPAVVRARRVVARRAARRPRSGASTCRRRCPASAPAA